jgi:hypothetical protein
LVDVYILDLLVLDVDFGRGEYALADSHEILLAVIIVGTDVSLDVPGVRNDDTKKYEDGRSYPKKHHSSKRRIVGKGCLQYIRGKPADWKEWSRE